MNTEQKPIMEVRIVDGKYATLITRSFWRRFQFLWFKFRYPKEVMLLENSKACVAIRTPADWIDLAPKYKHIEDDFEKE